MASPSEKLAQSLEILHGLQNAHGAAAIRAKDMTRTHRERLLKNGFLQEVIKGWYIPSRPDEVKGESTAWYASFWRFCGAYLESRFGVRWCLSPEQSLSLHAGNWTVPGQLAARSPRAANKVTKLHHGTSLLELLPHGITSRRHRFHDIVRDAVASGVAEGPGQTSGDHRVTALKESGEKTGSVPYHRQHRADIRRVVRKIMGGARNQGRLHREQPQAGLFLPVRHTRQRDAKLQQGRAMREFGDLVARARRPRRELAGHGPVAGMKRKRLFR